MIATRMKERFRKAGHVLMIGTAAVLLLASDGRCLNGSVENKNQQKHTIRVVKNWPDGSKEEISAEELPVPTKGAKPAYDWVRAGEKSEGDVDGFRAMAGCVTHYKIEGLVPCHS